MAQVALGAAGGAFGKGFGNAWAGPALGALGNMVGSFVDTALFNEYGPKGKIFGARLNDLKVQRSEYGGGIPRVVGSFRVAGNVIWARDIKERKRTQEVGGKGGSTPKADKTDYFYYATLAIAICEGEIDAVNAVYADSRKLSVSELREASGKYELFLGSETQSPSSIIESYDGVGETPAYRGVAYVVMEDFPLGDFGNRIPNFTFEVERNPGDAEDARSLVKSVVLIPGSGEFVYSRDVAYNRTSYVTYVGGSPVKNVYSKLTPANAIAREGVPNVDVALEQMGRDLPNLEWVAVVVNWFITSKVVADAEIVPKCEFLSLFDEGAVVHETVPDWEVAGRTRETGEVLNSFSDGSLTYGGTPTDKSVVQLCKRLKELGYNVLLYPMPLVDTTGEEPGEDKKPWRGRLVPAVAGDVDTFFNRTWGFSHFVEHYANLSVEGDALKDYIDAFLIGSEMVGLTTWDAGGHTFPAVAELVDLAATVKGIVGSGVKVSYAADWSEYHSVGGYYHLDPLWTSPDIDVVAIDNYMPITPDLPQRQITPELIKEYLEKGEGWDYYYSDPERTDEVSYGGDPKYAWKNVEYWWKNAHANPGGGATGWTAKAKPLWFTEFGFPSVDGAANQPNVFVDPSSDESYYPRGSRRRIDYAAQREAVRAFLEFWQAKNAEPGNEGLAEHMFLWAYDARPYPHWPFLTNYWTDGANFKSGHWINHKLAVPSLGFAVAELFALAGLEPSEYDVSALNDPVDGFVMADQGRARDYAAQLAEAYFFDVVEQDGKLVCVKRGGEPEATAEEDVLLPGSGDRRSPAVLTRGSSEELPTAAEISFASPSDLYETATRRAQRQSVTSADRLSLAWPLALSDADAERRALQYLYIAWTERTSVSFGLPPEFRRLCPTDALRISVGGATYSCRILSARAARSGAQRVEAVVQDADAYDMYRDGGSGGAKIALASLPSRSVPVLLDLPRFPGDSDENGILRVALYGDAQGWSGGALYRSDDGGEDEGNNWRELAQTANEATVGIAFDALPAASSCVVDTASTVDVGLFSGELASVTELGMLNGANAALIGEEIVQFQTATLLGAGRYRLSNLLRGRLGTEWAIGGHSPGERFVLLDGAILKTTVERNVFNLTRHYKGVTYKQNLSDAEQAEFAYAAECYKPWSPVHIAGERDGGGDLTITWIRRTRLGGEWADGSDVPLSEESEAYEVDILDGATVLRTIAATSPSCAYSAAQQTADFGSPQASVDVVVYQLSALVGRGRGGRGSL
ncbi:MAG: glycoside hydrolase TIM-barrel-like domain-containing protein [Rickettsiales bacterium]